MADGMTAPALDFAKRTDAGIDYWTTPESDLQWAEANELGAQRANQVIAAIRADRCPLLMNRVMQAMVEKGHYGPVEIGFAEAIGNELL